MPSPGFSELKFASADLSLDKERCWGRNVAERERYAALANRYELNGKASISHLPDEIRRPR
jgi:hypothetical protein